MKRIVGVKDLRDYLHVRPSADAGSDDRQIERAANRALRWDARLPKGLRAEVTGNQLQVG